MLLFSVLIPIAVRHSCLTTLLLAQNTGQIGQLFPDNSTPFSRLFRLPETFIQIGSFGYAGAMRENIRRFFKPNTAQKRNEEIYRVYLMHC